MEREKIKTERFTPRLLAGLAGNIPFQSAGNPTLINHAPISTMAANDIGLLREPTKPNDLRRVIKVSIGAGFHGR
jgi:hypothetical protein